MMPASGTVKRFATFSLDTANQCVLRGEERIHLTPKAFAVLSYLIDHAGRLVTKTELLDAVWADTFVQEAVLKVCILEIRKALGENSKEEGHIATVHRRGYRFNGFNPQEATHGGDLPGREAELRRLHAFLALAASGTRQVVFLTENRVSANRQSSLDFWPTLPRWDKSR